MNIEKSFGQKLMHGAGLTFGGYPITSFIADDNAYTEQHGGTIIQDGMKRLEGLAVPAGLVVGSHSSNEEGNCYKINPNISTIEENLFDTLFNNISHKSKGNTSRKMREKNAKNVTRGRK